MLEQEVNTLKINVLTKEQYDSIQEKSDTELYFATDEDSIFGTHLPLLTYQVSDHKLNDIQWLRADTFSWHSAGVYEAVYSHLEEDLKTAKHIDKKYLYSNIDNVGLTDRQGVLSGFTTTTKYANFNVKTPTRNMELVIDFETPTTYANASSFLEASQSTKGIVCRFTTAGVLTMWMSSNGSSWNVMSNWATGITIPTATKAKFKLTWDGSVYAVFYSLDGGNSWVAGNTLSSNLPIYWETGKQGIGGATWESYAFTNGKIDLNNSYLIIDDRVFWEGVTCDFDYYIAEDGHKIVSKEHEYALLNKYDTTGDGWYFVIDTANKRFKLPRRKNRYIIEQKTQGTSWYRLYSDGWCEQGGNLICTDEGIKYVSLLKNFRNTAYNVTTTLNVLDSRTTNWGWQCYINNKTVSGFAIYNSGISAAYTCHWLACGYLDIIDETTNEYLYFYVGNYRQPEIYQTASMSTELFNDKADRDLSNVSDFSKAITAMMPDYSRATDLLDFPHTATKNGYVVIFNTDNNYDLYIDGTKVFVQIDDAGGSNYSGEIYPLASGQTITCTLTGSTRRNPQLKFIPCKGVN